MPEIHRAKLLLPPIPAKRYFTIGEVSELCAVKPHVLRYWEQEFAQLKPVKRRGNRRYYQHHEVLLIRRIRDLLYDQGFTINGARHRLDDEESATPRAAARAARGSTALAPAAAPGSAGVAGVDDAPAAGGSHSDALDHDELHRELLAIRALLVEPAPD
ncbi:MAG: MerR family transcriptional regulator [Proteobacteria bacterium]|jgi:DNA-binding transcriptional MerR regulator|nr:MerR family transcriptional regulator [Pseudomonadota bacterium]